jgi:pimeloyl-ACP methyl ester carboxylesterase
MTKKLANLPGGDEVAYWTHHRDKKPVLVLVHGFTGSHKGFQYLVPLLSDYRLIIPDLPGFGVSPLPHHKVTLAELGKLLCEFVQTLGLDEPPHLLGHSMGSLVVAEAVKQHPELFAHKLILASPVPSPVKIIDSRRLGVLAGKLYYTASHRTPRLGKRIAKSRKITRVSTNMIMTATDREMKQAIHEHHFDNLNYISNIGWYRRLHDEINKTGINKYRRSLAKFDVLMINGEKDAVTPLKKQRKVAIKIEATLITIPEVGHLSHYEKPDVLSQAIADFLK